MMTSSPIQAFSGVPFVDREFNPSKLIAAVLASRAHRKGLSAVPDDLSSLLDPLAAAADRASSIPADAVIDSSALPSRQVEDVESAILAITHRVSTWRPLFGIPLRFRRMTRPGVISASSFGYPQHVFLGDDAFASDAELREQIIHETAHNWIYLIAEVFTISSDSAHKPDFTLPSGTAGKLPSEVLGALHVAQTLRYYYSMGSGGEKEKSRVVELSQYIDGCSDLVEAAKPFLTPAGQEIACRLQQL